MKNKLDISYSCEIDNLLDVMAEYIGITYEAVEKMAFKEGVFPEGSKVFVTTQFGNDNPPGSLRYDLLRFMNEQGIVSMDITYPI